MEGLWIKPFVSPFFVWSKLPSFFFSGVNDLNPSFAESFRKILKQADFPLGKEPKANLLEELILRAYNGIYYSYLNVLSG